jgi:cob(I)alamin adenosyltransferase
MIYTKTGDAGTTSLVGGTRVDKDDKRVEAYGTIDELNSHIGLLAEMVRRFECGYYEQLKAVQHHLFDIQTLLATEDEAIYSRLPQVKPEDIEAVEHQIDTITGQLPKLKNFVIAGGNIEGAQCHVCRTVCRRAERRIVALSHDVSVDAAISRYINRLSDYLFVLGRALVLADGKTDDLYIS